MMKSQRGAAGIVVLVLVAGLALAVANVVALLSLGHASSGTFTALLEGNLTPLLADARTIAIRCPACFLVIALGPMLLGLIAAFFAGRGTPSAPMATEPAPAPQPPDDSALRLLAVLQQEARFVDFIQEDIAAYEDAQIGAAVREIHADCRKALAERVEIARVFSEAEGTELEIAAGFDPTTVRLTGNVRGEPPFKGTLQHCGWRVVRVALPKAAGESDTAILAPAEVEIA